MDTVKNKTVLRSVLPYAVLAILFLAAPIVINNEYWTVVLVRVLISIVVALGLNLITGLIGQMNLGTAGMYALGSYTSALLTTRLGVSPWLALLACVAMGVIIGLVLGYPSLRLKGVYFSLTTIGFTQIVVIFINNLTKLTGGAKGVQSIPSFNIFGFSCNTYLRCYYLYFCFAVIALFVALRIVNGKWGRLFRSMRDNSDAVEMTGVDISWVKIRAFIACSIFGTIGGAMYAHFYGYVNPSAYTSDVSMNFVLMLLVGGLGSVPGTVVGAAVVTMLPELLRGLQDYYLLVFYSIIFLGILIFPNGWIDAIQRGFRLVKKFVTGKKGKGGENK